MKRSDWCHMVKSAITETGGIVSVYGRFSIYFFTKNWLFKSSAYLCPAHEMQGVAMRVAFFIGHKRFKYYLVLKSRQFHSQQIIGSKCRCSCLSMHNIELFKIDSCIWIRAWYCYIYCWGACREPQCLYINSFHAFFCFIQSGNWWIVC